MMMSIMYLCFMPLIVAERRCRERKGKERKGKDKTKGKDEKRMALYDAHA